MNDQADRPSDEEIAAAFAVVRLILRRRVGNAARPRERWLAAARAEGVGLRAGEGATRMGGWSTAERPR